MSSEAALRSLSGPTAPVVGARLLHEYLKSKAPHLSDEEIANLDSFHDASSTNAEALHSKAISYEEWKV